MIGEQGLQKAGEVRIEQLKLINAVDEIIDLTEFVVELNIYEDIFKNYLHGTIVLTDSRNIIDKYNIHGEEFLNVKLRTPSFPDSAVIQKTFRVFKLSDRTIVRDTNTQNFILHFISIEFFYDMSLPLFAPFEGNIFEVAGRIFTDFIASSRNFNVNELSNAVEENPAGTDLIVINETSNKVKFVSPGWSPFKCINWLATKAIPKDGIAKNFIFFESNKNFYFCTLEGLFKNAHENKNYFGRYVISASNIRKDGTSQNVSRELFLAKDVEGFKQFVSNKPLFAGDKNVRPNVITTVDRGTMANNKFKTFLGSNISDAQTALRKIAASSSAMSNIAKKLLRSDLNVPIEIVDVDYFTKDNMPEGVVFNKEEDFKAGGFYYSGKVYIARGTSRPPISLLLHEILHAYTTNYLAANPNSPAVKNFDRLLNHLRSPEISKLIADKYPLTDIDELLTGVFTNREFIEDLKLIPATNKNFKSIWDEILQIFKVVFGVKEVSLLDEIFAEASNIVELSMDEYIARSEESELYNETFVPLFAKDENGTGQQKIISNRLDELSTKAKNVNGVYEVEGYDINWKRPSSIAKAIIGGFTSGIKSDAQIQREKLYQDAGTILHAIQANIIKKNFPEYNQLVQDYEVPIELTEMAEVVEAQLKPIIQAAKDRGSIMKAEVFLGNVKSQKAGTADLLEITKDGEYYTYDLKTRFTTDKSGVTRFNKVHEWSLQTNEYNKMLESGDTDLGVVKGKVLGTYVLEFTVEPKADKIAFTGNVGFTGTKPEKYLANRKMKSFTIVAPTFLRTKDAKIDEMISKLLKQTEELKKFRGGTEIQREAKNQVLLSKLQLLQDLQLRKDVNKLLDAASFELSYIQELIESGNIQEEQQFIKEQLGLYSNLRSYFTEAPDELRIKMYKVQDLALDLNDKFLQMGKETIEEAANSTGILGFVNDVFAAVKDINWMRKMTTGISNVDNPLVATAYRTVTTALAKAREKIEVMANQLKDANNELKEYLGKVDYSMMIDGDELVQQFTKDFYKARKQAEKKGDYEWFEDNVTYNNAKYLEARDKQLNYQETFGKKSYANYLKLENPTMSADEIDLMADKEVAKRMQEWDANNKNDKTKYFTPKNKWLNPKWLEIKQGKYKGTPVEKFYDIYLANLEVANSIAPDKKFTKGFIANFSKNFIEKTAQNGLLGAIKGNASGLLDELSPGFDEAYGQRDIITGESVRSLYIPGTSDAKQDKSLDLATSMFKFMEGVYRYEELKDIEKVVIAVKQQLKSAKFLQTDKLGNLVKTGVTEGITIENSNTYQMFEAWSDAVLYGQYKKGDTAFKISGNGFGKLLGLKKDEEKAISVGKVVDAFIKYTSIRNLGFNMYSPITNLFGGATNQYMTGASGAYYSGANLTKAYSLVLGGKTNFSSEEIKKARLILDWLKIDTGEFSQNVSEKLSAYRANKLLSDWNSMTLMRESENVLREAGALAMILSGKHGVTMEDFNLVNGKLETKLDIYKRETLRQKVIRINNKNIGGINNDDLMMAKTYITGRLLMQHRSWLPALFYSRFGQKQKDYVLEQDIEGRYVTAYRLFKYYFNKSKFQELEEFEKANMKETATEAALILATGTLLFLLKAGLDDDDKEEAYYKITTKVSSRFLAELTFFIPLNFPAQYQILLKPAAAAGTAEDLGRFVGSLYTEAMGDEKEKEKNKPTRKALKLIPGANKVESFLNDLGYTE